MIKKSIFEKELNEAGCEVLDGVRINFEKGWGLVRASNTTPVLVTRFESVDEALAKEYEESVNNLIAKAQERL